jgi:hypothetical protein
MLVSAARWHLKPEVTSKFNSDDLNPIIYGSDAEKFRSSVTVPKLIYRFVLAGFSYRTPILWRYLSVTPRNTIPTIPGNKIPEAPIT